MDANIKQFMQPPRPWDWPTAGVIALMVVGFPVLGVLQHAGALPAPLALVLGTLLMNLSFTAWHEPAHGNFSASRRANTVAGWLASFASVYPGYFARRREHLVHHRFEGVEGKDPVYPRIQCGPVSFLFGLVRGVFDPPPLQDEPEFVPFTAAQRRADRVSNVLAAGVVVACFAAGYGIEVLTVWIVPRAIVFVAHAYYVCFLPHAIPGGGYQLYRIRPDRRWLEFLTVGQNLHGVHHRWPGIPWHRYKAVLAVQGTALDEEGIEQIPRARRRAA